MPRRTFNNLNFIGVVRCVVVEHLGVGGAPLRLETVVNLINELRMLAEDMHVNGYNRYSATTSKAADELASLQRYRTAYNEWVDKTEWVQEALPAKYLGMHRADALKDLISELEERCAKWGAVFGHLGDTPDECGNAIIAARDELENRCDELSADKGTWYRMSEVFSKKITEVEDALKASEERCAVLTDALIRIANWDTHNPQCAIDHGSNGVRNYYRNIARAALENLK